MLLDLDELLLAIGTLCAARSDFLPLFEGVTILDLCWLRMLTNNSTVALMASAFSPEAVRIEYISKLVSPFLNAPDLNLLIHFKHFSTNGDCSSSIPSSGKLHFKADSLVANSLDNPSSMFLDKAVPDEGDVDPWGIDCRMGMK